MGGRAGIPRNRLLIGLWQATGPLAWVNMRFVTPTSIIVVFALAWSAWLMAVLATDLRERSYATHLAASCLWCVCGCPPAGLVIT